MESLGIDQITASYLNLQTPKENRGNVLCFVLLFLNLMGLLPLVGEPFVFSFFIIGFIPAVVINIWGLLYVIAPYRFELSYYLYMGIYSIVNVFVYSLVLAKLLLYQLGVQGKFTFILTLITINSLPMIMNWVNYRLLYNGTYHKLQNERVKLPAWILIPVLSPGIGYFIYVLVSSFGSDIAVWLLLFFCLFLLSLIIAYFSLFIHRYFFLKRHMETVLKVYPKFGQPKRHR